MIVKRALVMGGVVAALAVPAGAALAATGSPATGPVAPGPAATAPATTLPYGPRFGAGQGPGAGYGDPADCPYYNSADHQQWMQDRQHLMLRLHDGS